MFNSALTNNFLAVLSPFLFGCLALYLIGTYLLFGAIALVVIMLAITYKAVKIHGQHHRSEQFDDRVSGERMQEAVEYYINKRGDRKNVED